MDTASDLLWQGRADPNLLSDVSRQVTSFARESGMDEKSIGALDHALGEACENVIVHSCQRDPSMCYAVKARMEGKTFILDIFDNGQAMHPVFFPAKEDRPSIGQMGGWGKFFMVAYADEGGIEYETGGSGNWKNRLTMKRHIGNGRA